MSEPVASSSASMRRSRSSADGRNSGSSMTRFLWNSFVGRRNEDYRGEEHPSPAAAAAAATTDSVDRNMEGVNFPRASTAAAATTTTTTTSAPAVLAPREQQRYLFRSRQRWKVERILRSGTWKFFLIVFALVVLFGASIRELFLPKSADLAVDVVFLVALVFFAIDMALRIGSEPGYLSCPVIFVVDKNQNDRHKRCVCPRLGSFLFWCDFCSTMTLFYDLSFLNKTIYGEKHLSFEVGPWGDPISFYENSNRPVQKDFALLILIFRTARVARFIRSSRAIKISSRVNWYLMLNLFNPFWYCSQLRRTLLCRQRRRDTTNKFMEATNNTNNSSALGMIIESKPASSDLSDKYGRRKIKTSWGTVGLAVVSANRIASKNQGPPNTNFQQMLGYVTRLFGGSSFPLQTEEFRRQMAAIKIQRAWRRQREKHHNGSMTEGHDVGYYSTEFFGHDRRTSDHSFRGGGGRMNDTNNRGTIATRSRPATALSRAFDPSSGSTSFGADAPTNKRRNESQVGSAMRELTGQRVALGIILAFLLTVFFTYVEENATRPAAMIVLHNQTANAAFADRAISAARQTAIPDLFQYTLANEETRQFNVVEGGVRPSELRSSERLRISISGYDGQATIGLFSIRDEQQEKALVGLVATIFILLVWFFGVTAFAGPVMVLVVIPIERMVRLLDMLMVDPLGYQGTPNYKRFTDEENEITKNTRWTNEILKGMETSFLMSTISRIGSLMKVGFGSAGVEIIRNNLEKGKSKNMLILNNQGSTVSCIFLFCDIRSFTDATECLQEEVFVFTNRIAAVVHSYVASYGGSANKNVGDAFLLSWLLEEEHTNRDRLFDGHDSFSSNNRSSVGFTARNHQADKALLSVVKICIALHYDEYYIEAMTEQARSALLAKLKNRKGPVVQMGFGLHAGRAVQGAIGSQRKIDATYVSEAVELAEFLESSTKKYGVKMLMSRSFHDLLHPSNRRRCRKVDQIWIREDEDDADEEPPNGENTLDLFTFDINVDALWDEKKRAMKSPRSDAGRDSDSVSDTGSKRGGLGLIPIPRARRASMRNLLGSGRDATTTSAEDAISERAFLAGNSTSTRDLNAFEVEGGMPAKLVLPTGLALYNPNVWTSEEMRIMRQLYSDGLFFQKFSSGLQSFYVSRDWDHARQCFSTILERFEDGPSRYFLSQIEKYGSKPPRDFVGYGTA